MAKLLRRLLPLLLLLADSLSAGAQSPAPLVAPLSSGHLSFPARLHPGIPSPAEALGYPLGERVTAPGEVATYLARLAAASPRAQLLRYGKTYEGRPLLALLVSSPENLSRLAPEASSPTPRGRAAGEDRERIPAVWLSSSIHGNEAAPAEAAMLLSYLLTASGGEWEKRLDNLLLILDPLANPDGRALYLRSRAAGIRLGLPSSPRLPFAGGRENHFLLDLNRDWAWATQVETRQRLALMRRFEPQVFVDLHEMEGDDGYLLPQRSPRMHPAVDRRIVGWIGELAGAAAEAIAAAGWSYRRGGSFDLSYPGFGDVYTSLRGAVGMTFEVAAGEGSDRARHFTLADRLARHVVASLALLAAVEARREPLLADLDEVGTARRRGPGRVFTWDCRDPEAGRLGAVLRGHGISTSGEVGAAAASPCAATSEQPLGALVEGLLGETPSVQGRPVSGSDGAHPSRVLAEPAVPLTTAFGIDPGDGPRRGTASSVIDGAVRGDRLALLTHGSAPINQALSHLRRGGRASTLCAPADGPVGALPAGTIVLGEVGDRPLAAATAREVSRSALPARWLGGSVAVESFSLRLPRPALLVGRDSLPASVGPLAFLVREELGLEVPYVDLEEVSEERLAGHDVLIWGAQRSPPRWRSETLEILRRWVAAGGVLIAVEESVGWAQQLVSPPPGATAQGGQSPAALAESTGWLVVRTEARATHLLTLARGAAPVLLRNLPLQPPSGDPFRDVVVLDPAPHAVVTGPAERRPRMSGRVALGWQRSGRGAIVSFPEHPFFRAMWRATSPWLLAAVVYAPSALANRECEELW